MTIAIRPIEAHEHEAARRLLLENGWQGGRFDSVPFAAMIAGSHRALVAIDGDVVVGFVRAVSDGISNGYLCTLVVAGTHRGRGIARSLVAAVMGDEPDMTWVLRAERPGLVAFYEKLGFRHSQVTMERVRSASLAPDAVTQGET